MLLLLVPWPGYGWLLLAAERLLLAGGVVRKVCGCYC